MRIAGKHLPLHRKRLQARTAARYMKKHFPEMFERSYANPGSTDAAYWDKKPT